MLHVGIYSTYESRYIFVQSRRVNLFIEQDEINPESTEQDEINPESTEQDEINPESNKQDDINPESTKLS